MTLSSEVASTGNSDSITGNNWWELLGNVFCPTGDGGGCDSGCSQYGMKSLVKPTKKKLTPKSGLKIKVTQGESEDEGYSANELSLLTSNISGKVRRETLDGRDYLVVPMRMLKEGVLNGSKGPLFYPQSEISRGSDAWNNMPIVVNHPTKDGKACSARSPKILEQFGIGTVFNTVVGGPLDAEAWLDYKKSRQLIPNELAKAEAGEPIELSTGLFTDNQPVKNDGKNIHNSKTYTHVARNYRPDHLAILPNKKGACSVKDGCGVNVNEESVENHPKHSNQKSHGNRGGSGDSSIEDGFAESDGIFSKKFNTEEEADKVVDKIMAHSGSTFKGKRVVRASSEDLSQAYYKKKGKAENKFLVEVVTENELTEDEVVNAKVMTTVDHGHSHEALVNADGDGETTEDNGHTHQIVANKVLEADDHSLSPRSSGHDHEIVGLPTANEADLTVNPFVSEEQRRYMWSQHPDIARKWAHGEHSAKKDHKMPKKTGKNVKGPLAEAERKAQEEEEKKATKKATKNEDDLASNEELAPYLDFDEVENWYDLVGNEAGCTDCGESCDCTDCKAKHGKEETAENSESEWVEELVNNAKLSGGSWKTIAGQHVYVKGGSIVAGNPNPGKKKAKSSKSSVSRASVLSDVKKAVVSSGALKARKANSGVQKASRALKKSGFKDVSPKGSGISGITTWEKDGHKISMWVQSGKLKFGNRTTNNETLNTETIMLKSDMIAELIANCGVWDESDEQALNAMPDAKLEAVYNHHIELVTAQEQIANADDMEYEDDEEEEEEAPAKGKIPPQFRKKGKPAKGKIPPQFMKNEETHTEPVLATTDNAASRLTADEQADIQWARQQRQQVRNELIESITANEASDFTDEYLGSRSLEELQGLAKLATANAAKEETTEQPKRMQVLNFQGAGGANVVGPKLTENFHREDQDMAPNIIDWKAQAAS